MADELERAQKALRDLSRSLKSMTADASPKAVHKLRTTTRRVEAIAAVLAETEGKESRRLLKAIEPVRKAAGHVRDMDVLMSNARKLARYSAGNSLARLVEQLQIARRRHADDLRRALSRRRDAAREHLKGYSKLVRIALSPAKQTAAAGDMIRHSREEVHTAALNVVRELGAWPPLDAGNIHEFRLKVKELRYILQLADDADPRLLNALANVQRRVGDWHDWQQLDEMAREILDPERDARLLQRIALNAMRRFERALTAANALRGKYLTMPLVAGI
jgi:CHAD domain-containing protein